MAKRTFIAIIGTVLLSLLFISSCGSPTKTHYRDGRLYFLNNTRPATRPDEGIFVRDMVVEFEGVEYEIPFNMDGEGNPTGAGPRELTDSPLLGGTKVFPKCTAISLNGERKDKTITATIDGNITVEAYWEKWSSETSSGRSFLLRVVPGRWDGITIIE